MNIRLRIALIVGIIGFATCLIKLLLRKKVNLKYALLWMAMIIIMSLAVMLPNIVISVSEFFGFITPANFIFVLAGMFALLILVSFTVILSHMNKRIFRLVQEVALLENRLREINGKVNIGEKNDGTSV